MRRLNRIILISILLFAIGIYFIAIFPLNLSDQLNSCYITLVLTYVYISIAIVYTISREDYDIFEPINIVLIMYLSIFTIRPILDIVNNDYYVFGENPMSGCIKASLIVCASLLTFMIGYFSKKTTKAYKKKYNFNESNDILLWSWIIWIISFILSVINLMLTGLDLKFILSFGTNAINDNIDTTSGIAALSFFSYSMIAPWLLICIFGKKRVSKIIISFLMLSLYVVRGTRIILLAMLIAPVIFYYISKNKRPKITLLISALTIFLIFMSFMQLIRNNLRKGETIEINSTDDVMIKNVFDSDLTTYKAFYCIVNSYPSKYKYTFGKAMILQTIITVIPRSFWNNKPDAVITEIISNAINQKARIAGMAAPGLAEYYFEFGILGCIICMYIMAIFFRNWKILYMKEKNTFSYIKYSLIYSIIFQLVIRTSTTYCIYQYIFTILPLYIATKVKIKSKKDKKILM